MLSEIQKNIYNSFLKVTRTVKNKPFRYRKNFESIDSTTEVILKKLERLFASHSSISYDTFFTAPYKVYNDQEFFDLQFFVTQKAIKCYTTYVKQREIENPDSESAINMSKAACSFIYKFCKSSEITLDKYKNSVEGNIPLPILHLKEHKINYYTLHALYIKNLISPDMKSIFTLMFDNFFNTYSATQQKFIKSVRHKSTIRTALKLIEEKLLIFENNKIQ